MQQLLQRKTKTRTLLFYGIIYLGLFSVLLITVRYFDDWFYVHQSRSKSLFPFLREMYSEWSGRIIPNALAFLLLEHWFWLWRLITAGAMMLLAWSVARLATEDVGFSQFGISLCLILLMPVYVLKEVFLWATGSIYYLWPLAAAAFLLIPFADSALRNKERNDLLPLRVMAAVFAGCSNEQVGLCTLGFMVVSLCFCAYKRRKPSWQQLLLFGVTLICFVIMISAPGNAIRYAQEATTGFPGFLSLSLGTRIGMGFRWMLERVFGSLTLLVLFAYALALYDRTSGSKLKRHENDKRWFTCIATFLLLVALSSLLLRDVEYQIFFTFKPLSGSALSKLSLLFPQVFWVAFAAIGLWLIFRARPFAWLCLSAAMCTLLMMCFSPTLYTSGYRTSAVAGVILAFVVQLLLPGGRIRRWAIRCLPVMALVNLGYLLLDGFYWMRQS